MPSTFDDKIRGMLLLGAYGDALGAAQEGQETPTPDPLPKTLTPRDMPEWGEAWGTWLPAIVHAKTTGLPTDDTCYRLCILHPWLAAIADKVDERTFDEASLRDFMAALRHEPLYPEWYSFACRDHLKAWLDMFQAQEENRTEGVFSPGVPGVFGLFLYLEMAAVRHGTTPLETFAVYHQQAGLDQGYAKDVTAFLATLVSLAVNEASQTDSFGDWFFGHSRAVLDELAASQQDVVSLRSVLEASARLGTELHGETEGTLNTVFKQRVVDPPTPPFLTHAFMGGTHDPYRALAHITATTAYAPDDPAVALRTIAHSCGHTDTLASLLGTLLGAWYGAERLSAIQSEGLDFQAELNLVEATLTDLFHFDLGQHVQIFSRLHSS